MTYKEASDMIPMVEAQYNTRNFVRSSFTANRWFEKVVEALEKQIPKKPRKTRCALMCGCCGHKITEFGCKKSNIYFCKVCGQAIDWSDD